ncbi:MAG: response regulator [Bacteriovoracaceae bacterium]|jgi:response regulator RpfG family c-di-GMP phosphodiesterase|nr:response regulator [Bacteriovoracaceae bacterium]
MPKSKIQILIVEDEMLIREMTAVLLGEKYDVDIIESDGAHSAIEILQNNHIDLIISDFNMPAGNGDQIYLHNKKHNRSAFIFITSVDIKKYDNLNDFFQNKNHFFLSKPFTQEQIFTIFDQIFKDYQTDKEKPESDDENNTYSSIPIGLAYNLSSEVGEIYIKINNRKYLKYLDKVEYGDVDKFKKLEQKGCSEIFVLSLNYQYWIQSRLAIIKNNLIEMSTTVNSSDHALATVLQLSRVVFNVGSFSTSFVSEFEQSLDIIMSNIWSSGKGKQTIQEMLEEKSIIQTHSSICLFLCKLINSKVNLNDKAKYKKLALASLFHDIALITESDTNIQSFDQLSNANISDEKKESVLFHSVNSSHLLEQLPALDLDTLEIIKHHHELPHGEGYPEQIDLKGLKVLSRQFNLVHYVSYIIARNGTFSKGDYFAVRDIFDDDEFLVLLDFIFDHFRASKED